MRLSWALKEIQCQFKVRHVKAILQHDNAGLRVGWSLKSYLKTLKWIFLTHALYSLLDSAPDYHLLQSVTYDLSNASILTKIPENGKEVYRLSQTISPLFNMNDYGLEKWKTKINNILYDEFVTVHFFNRKLYFNKKNLKINSLC